MQGTVTSFDQESGQGVITAQDGAQLRFEVEDLEYGYKPEAGAAVDFQRVGDEASEIRPVAQNFDVEPYAEPQEFYLITEGDMPEGFEILKKSALELSAEGRLESTAKYKLSLLCKRCGANAALFKKSEPFLRNSIGFSFCMHRVYGVPVVIAKPDPQSALTRAEIARRFDDQKVKRLLERRRASKRGLFWLKNLGLLLVFIFILGYFISR